MNEIRERFLHTARCVMAAELAAGRAALTEMKKVAADKLEQMRGDNDDE